MYQQKNDTTNYIFKKRTLSSLLVISTENYYGQTVHIRICKFVNTNKYKYKQIHTNKSERDTEEQNRYLVNEGNLMDNKYTIWHSISLVIREMHL